jgi:hypothetical protein
MAAVLQVGTDAGTLGTGLAAVRDQVERPVVR